MNTPICDFVNEYIKKNAIRAHMPGHKGKSLLGFEKYDITEISGADSLYEASGIIAESEGNASRLFGCKTFYSTEGSSHCIRAMMYLAMQYADRFGKEKLVLAGRNAHKVFLSAAALCDFDIDWLYSEKSYLSCNITPELLDKKLSGMEKKPCAVYVTTPDYLGNVSDIKGISAVCKKHDVLLCVDNAHGAYLRFLAPSLHPCDLGADMCCDSAHKTLGVITGGAYLHIGEKADFFDTMAKEALALFGSTSPSYLILQSLDMANKVISDSFAQKLEDAANTISKIKKELEEAGFTLYGNEPLKICILTKPYGYAGSTLAALLSENGIECEFSDNDHLVLMLTPHNTEQELSDIKNALVNIKKLPTVEENAPCGVVLKKAMSVRRAMFSSSETVHVNDSVGRILAAPNVSCPPAVPIAVCGEIIDEKAREAFRYYGIEYLKVVR